MKVYDQTYFNRWYRDPNDRVSTRESLVRKVRMAVSVTEFLLGREIRSVLDVVSEATVRVLDDIERTFAAMPPR